MAVSIKPTLQNYLKFKGWQYKDVDDENIAIKRCPFCGTEKSKFSVHKETTQFRCWSASCGKTGNLYTLKKALGDLSNPIPGVTSVQEKVAKRDTKKYKKIPIDKINSWHEALLSDEKRLKLVASWRGFSLEAIKHFRLGIRFWCPKGYDDPVWWLCIPHINDSECHNIKFRTLPEKGVKKDFRRVAGYASVLYNADCLHEHEDIVIAEGETDTISLWEAGIKNVVGLTCGADTFKVEWYDALTDKDRFFLFLDSDTAGQKGAREIGRRLGFDRTWNVILPEDTDANDVLLSEGSNGLVQQLARAKQFDVYGCLTLDDILVEAAQADENSEPGLLTEWKAVNKRFGNGPKPGDLVVVSAVPKTGKTTWSIAWGVYLAKQGVPVLIYCLEMKPRRLAEKIVAALRCKPIQSLRPIDFQIARFELRNLPMYFIDPRVRDDSGKITTEFCINKIREAVKRYGIKFCVFDHLHFLCRSLDHVTAEVGRTTKEFKNCATELEIVMCLIAQPKKLPSDRPPTSQDLKHSGDIHSDADWIIILWRKRINAGGSSNLEEWEVDTEREAMESKTLVRVDAARFAGGGDSYLDYDGTTASFSDYQVAA